MKTEFPKSLEAAKASNNSQWPLGDALIEECSTPGPNGVRDESREKLVRCAKELENNGIDFTAEYIRQIRRTAANFTPGTRIPGVPFTVHRYMGNPERLQAFLKWAEEKGKIISVKNATEFLRTLAENKSPAEPKSTKRKPKSKKKELKETSKEVSRLVEVTCNVSHLIHITSSSMSDDCRQTLLAPTTKLEIIAYEEFIRAVTRIIDDAKALLEEFKFKPKIVVNNK